jgi:hypothetical protein
MSALVRMFVSVPVTSVRSVVSGAPLARIENESCEVAFDYCLDVAAATSHDRDAVGFEFVFGPFAHIARQHRRNAVTPRRCRSAAMPDLQPHPCGEGSSSRAAMVLFSIV